MIQNQTHSLESICSELTQLIELSSQTSLTFLDGSIALAQLRINELFSCLLELMSEEEMNAALDNSLQPTVLTDNWGESKYEALKHLMGSVVRNMEMDTRKISNMLEPSLSISSLIKHSGLPAESTHKYLSSNLHWYPMDKVANEVVTWNLIVNNLPYDANNNPKTNDSIIRLIKVIDPNTSIQDKTGLSTSTLLYALKSAIDISQKGHTAIMASISNELPWMKIKQGNCMKTELISSILKAVASSRSQKLPEHVLANLLRIMVTHLRPMTNREALLLLPEGVVSAKEDGLNDLCNINYLTDSMQGTDDEKSHNLTHLLVAIIPHTNVHPRQLNDEVCSYMSTEL